MFFSIIVPVYKVEDYLEVCVESILSQSYEDFELILIDDGSPDLCPRICDDYRMRDKRVKVIHKNNGGLSSARNAGLEIAKGEYIIFVDSDDIIYPNSLKEIKIKLSDSPDVLITEYYSSPNCQIENIPKDLFTIPDICKSRSVIPYVFYEKKNTWASVQYIIKKDLINIFHLRFDVGYYHEDISWTSRVFLHSKSHQFYNKVWYVRRPNRPGSITTTVNAKRALDTIELVSKQIHSSDYNTLPDNDRHIMFNQFLRAVFSNLTAYKKYNRTDQIAISDSIKENIDIFDYAIARRHRAFVTLMKSIGVDKSLKLYCTLLMKSNREPSNNCR